MRTTPQWTEFRHYPAITGTMLLAVLVSVWWWTGGSIDMLDENSMLARGQVWRLLTSALPHVNFWHLIFNLYWCWVFGTAVEGAFGHLRTVGILALLAIGSGAADYAVLDGGVGLSGVGYGLFGLLWVLHRRDPRFADALDPQTVVMFIGWFIFCIVATYTRVMPVANVAHGMGALLGVVIGYAISLPQHRKVVSVAATVMVVVSILGATILRPWTNLSATAGHDAAARGYVALMTGHNEEAVDWYTYAAKLSPREATNWFSLGLALQRTGRDAEALADLSKAIELDPKNGLAYRTRGVLRYDRQAWEEALADFRKAVELDLNDDYGRIYISLVRARLGETEAAAKELQDYLKLRQGKAEDWAAKVCGFLAGQMTEDEFLKAAGSTDAKVDSEQHCEAYFYVGTKWLLEGDKATAKDYFEKCLATGQRMFTEYESAMAELKLLKGEK